MNSNERNNDVLKILRAITETEDKTDVHFLVDYSTKRDSISVSGEKGLDRRKYIIYLSDGSSVARGLSFIRSFVSKKAMTLQSLQDKAERMERDLDEIYSKIDEMEAEND
jgi:hypothetical protein